MVTRPRSRAAPKTDRRVPVSINGKSYLALPDIQRIQVDDAPPHVPTSGEQSAKSRPWHNVLSIKKIKNDFAHQVELDFDEHLLTLDHLANNSGFDTRWGPIYMGLAENNPTNPTDAGFSVWMPPSGVDTATGANRNPRGVIFFSGTTNSGLFAHRTDETTTDTLDSLRWTGTAWTEEAQLVSEENTFGHNQVIHKGALCLLAKTSGLVSMTVHRSTDGDTFAAMASTITGTATATAGSKLLDAGNRLYAFLQDRTTTGAFDVSSTDNDGGTWTERSTNHPGILRDVEYFHDWVADAESIFVLTEASLFIYDTTNFVVAQRMQLPARGHALLPFNVNGQRALLIFMDAGRVHALLENGTRLDISPGGSQGMPSGKDFGPAVNGQTCVTTTGQYAYALFSGLTTGGSAIAPLCLAFDGSVEIVDGKVASAGWFDIWQKADTSIAAAARFVAFDPVSGDLLMGVQDAVSEDTTLVQLKDIEVNPELQGTLDRRTAATLTLPRLSFGTPLISTLVIDAFVHSNGLDANETLAVAYRTNGSTGAYTTVATITADNTLIAFPDNSATAAGVNFRDIQLQLTGTAAAATDVYKVFEADIGFTRIWPVRYIYVITVDTNAKGMGIPATAQQQSNLDTLQAVTTKVQLRYGSSGIKMVLPIPSQKGKQMVGDQAVRQNAGIISGLYTLYLMEA